MFVVIDLEHRDQLLSHNLDITIGSPKVKGFRQSKAWANNQWVYFTANFSLPVLSVRYNAKKSIAILYFGQTLVYNKQDKVKTNEIFCNVALSFTSQDGAQRNSQVEINPFLIKMDNEGASKFKKGGRMEDYTIDMVKSDLKVMEEYASKIASLLDKLGYVEPWIASKIYIAGENIENIKHYLEYEVEGFPKKK